VAQDSRPLVLSPRFFVLCFIPLVCFAVGCQKPAAQPYYAPVERTFDAQPSPDRLMGAFVPRGQYLWTFKAVGPADQIAQNEAAFLAFLKTLKFEKDEELPTWELPAGWEVTKEDPVARMGRYITIKLPDAKDVDFAVSRAESPSDTITKVFLASNLTRWRGQLENREPVRANEYDELVGHVDAAGVDVHTVSVYGVFRGGPMAPRRQASEAAPKRKPAQADFKYEVPEGWTPTAGNSMRILSYEIIGENDTKAEVSLSMLGPFSDAHTLLSNVNRWRGEAKLADIDDAAAAALPKIKIGEDEAVLVEAIAEAEGGKSVIGAICDKGSQVWFVKLFGPAALVSREKENFLKFTSSLELP
jgi:hypothetical protein